ncbi:MAG: protein-glutamate O-methyltransferase CheR [Oscillospiraceae bacterium]
MDVRLTDADFSRIVNYIHGNYGINLIKKRVLIEGRLSNLTVEKGCQSFKEYFDLVFSDPSGKEVREMVNRLTTNHTFFLREPEHFEFLKKVVLPRIEQTVRDKDARIWCAASSTGEEPYTLAMVIDEYFGAKKAEWDLKILATDISTAALEKARKAEYSAESVKTLPAEWVNKYFEKISDSTYRVRAFLRGEVVFRQFNLMDKIIYKKPFDLISCRNVMIYFDTPTKDALIDRMYDAMKNQSYLFIGHAESISKNSRFTYIQPAIYQKKET